MTEKTREDLQGLEYDWLATDADAHVALFSTSGGGYAPDEFLRDTDAHDAAIEAILKLPPRSAALFAPTLPPGRENVWSLMAERGVFAFDSDPHGGPYRLVAAPQAPVKLADLPQEAARAVSRMLFRNLRFLEAFEVGSEALQAGE